MSYSNFHRAKRNKRDEFYTLFTDVEKELVNYNNFFKDKIIYCNCDDFRKSSFWKYFHLNFNSIGLNKLISTHCETKYKIEYMGGNDSDVSCGVLTELHEYGDFRSGDCLSIIDESDIVVTNPPFSLFRNFVNTILSHNSDFIVIGNTNAIVYSDIFELFKLEKIKIGYTNFNVGMYFKVPDDYEYSKIIDGERCARVSNSCWYTSLPIKKLNKELKLNKKYNPIDYPKYDNYDAINVNNFNDIPFDYNGIIGVPITFLDRYNSKQFEIVGLSSKNHSQNIPRFHDNSYYSGYVRGKVKTRVESNMPLLSIPDFGGTKCSKEGFPDIYQLYWRIFIRKVSNSY